MVEQWWSKKIELAGARLDAKMAFAWLVGLGLARPRLGTNSPPELLDELEEALHGPRSQRFTKQPLPCGREE